MPLEAEHDLFVTDNFTQWKGRCKLTTPLCIEKYVPCKTISQEPIGGLQTLSIEAKAGTGHGRLHSN